ncbi:MAG: lysine biosynthesis protein LysW [Thaumarchaeota archaeon]|nr:lysine biosynthesis protein LysW [Nitrososphaerota archaeon]
MKTKCEECDAEITLPEDVIKGEITSCPDCGVDFEVIEVSSGAVKLKVAETTGEDWGE